MKKLLPLSMAILLFMACSCSKEVIQEVAKGPGSLPHPEKCGTVLVSKDGFNSDNSKEMFLDDEPDSILFNRKMRVNQPLQLSIDGNQNLKFAYYGPIAINDVTIWASITGYDEEFKLAHFETIPFFTEFSAKLPMVDKTLEYSTVSGKSIEISANPYISAADLALRVECNDPFYTKVTQMKSDIQVSFGTYHTQGGGWTKILPSHAREGVAMVMNMGYMFETEEFAQMIRSHKFYSDSKEESLVPSETIIQRAKRRGGSLVLGTVVGLNGLGGGNVLGVAEWQYFEHYGDDKCEHEALFHEYGHCLGFGHSGNMTYNSFGGDTGFVNLCHNLYGVLSSRKELPVYSRRFLHTRRKRKTYGQAKYQSSKYLIEGAELDALDGGLYREANMNDMPDPLSGTPIDMTLDYTMVPGATTSTFSPKDVCALGDNIYVLNDAAGNHSVEIFAFKNGKLVHSKTLKEWTVNGTTNSFADEVSGIGAGDGKIFVNSVASHTEVFDASTLEYITTIGTGAWGYKVTETIHAYETKVFGDYVFLQDKQKVNVYRKDDVIPGSRNRVSRIVQTQSMGDTFDVFGFDMDKNSKVYVTYGPSKKLYVYDFSRFMELITINSTTEWSMPVAIIDVACFGDRLIGVQKSKPFLVEVNKNDGTVIKNFQDLYEFNKLEKINVAHGTFMGVDRGDKKVVFIPLSSFK